MDFTPDGRWGISGGGDGRVILWDLENESAVPLSGEANSDSVRSVTISGEDGRVLFWDLQNAHLANPLCRSAVESIAMSDTAMVIG